MQVEKTDKKADLVEKLVDDIAVERQLAAADKSSKVTPAAARRKSDGGKSSLKSLRWADRMTDQADTSLVYTYSLVLYAYIFVYLYHFVLARRTRVSPSASSRRHGQRQPL